MIQIPKDFKEFIQLLSVHEVKYVIIGGYAVAVHGYVRYTGDIDFFIAIDSVNAAKMVTVFREFGLDAPEVAPELFMDEGKILRVGTEPMRLEVLNQIDGVTFDECFRNRRELLVDGLNINFVGLNELLKNKRSTKREKDKADVVELEKRNR